VVAGQEKNRNGVVRPGKKAASVGDKRGRKNTSAGKGGSKKLAVHPWSYQGPKWGVNGAKDSLRGLRKHPGEFPDRRTTTKGESSHRLIST